MLTTETVDALKTSGKELHVLTADGRDVVVRRPTRAEYKRFRAQQVEPAKRSEALEQLTRDCLVYPDHAAYNAMLDERPALADVFGMRVLELAGLTGEAEAKKL